MTITMFTHSNLKLDCMSLFTNRVVCVRTADLDVFDSK
jgi:hypothetical protein